MNTTKIRYSDAELDEFRELIIGKIEKAEKDFSLLKKILANDGNGTQDTAPEFKGPLEEGAMGLSREEVGKLAQRQGQFILCLKVALVRVKNKNYGICRQTGKLISKERLRAVPHATLCIEAKNGNGHDNNGHRK